MDESDQVNIVAFRARQTELIEILGAINGLLQNRDWLTLKDLLFDRLVVKIKGRLLSEAEAKEIDNTEIFRLQGELSWARTYADLKSYAERLKLELETINKKLK